PRMTSDMAAGDAAPRMSFVVATSSTASAPKDTNPGQAGPPGTTMMPHRINSDATTATMLTRFDTKSVMNASRKMLYGGGGSVRPPKDEWNYRLGDGAGRGGGSLWKVELETSYVSTRGVPSTTVLRSFTTSG